VKSRSNTPDKNSQASDPADLNDVAVTVQEPSAANREPSAAGGEPSAANKEPSAAGKEPSAAGKAPSAANKEPSATEVVAYLRTHTDFFLEYPDLLAVLSLPRDDGRTISFAHRQASLLRKRNADLRGRLQALLANAKSNDALFEKSRNLGLSLMRADSEADLNSMLEGDLIQAFGADHLSCFLQSDYEGNKGMLFWCTRYPLAELFDANAPRCVTLRTRELDVLFPNRLSRGEGSAVLIPLHNSEGMLAIGSDNREQFNNDMGMLFVDYIGELVDVTVQRLIRAFAE
jgi:uncharacterized protein YigA (DUF484 family)